MKILKNLRIISQAVVLLLFLAVFVMTRNQAAGEPYFPVKLFFAIDPLVLLTTFLSSHALQKILLMSIVVIAVTVVFGRVFCGWFCPMGTIHAVASKLNRKEKHVPEWMPRIKYFILLFILAGAVFGLNLSGFLDPLSILVRSLSLTVYPLLNLVVSFIFDAAGYPGIDWLEEAMLRTSRFLGDNVLPESQPYFYQSAFIGTIFFVAILLNLVSRRFWCRFLCPLGALLSLLSRFSPIGIKVSESCISCVDCRKTCPTGAIPEDGKGRSKPECIACMNCTEPCPVDAVAYGITLRTEPLSITKRSMFASVASGVLSVPLLRVFPNLPNSGLIRPPGSLEEAEFLRRCIRCGNCMKVCPTNGLQPTLSEAGLEGMWTPKLVPRIGPCEYNCTLCGHACPTGAIKELTKEQKIKIRIGQAFIDRSRCLPWAFSEPCIVCEEMCPVTGKAIGIEYIKSRNTEGRIIEIGRPHVDLEKCTGCGKCENACPLVEKPAIQVTSLNESRSGKNRL
jgi:MauM/NapG family ferredoxin protein